MQLNVLTVRAGTLAFVLFLLFESSLAVADSQSSSPASEAHPLIQKATELRYENPEQAIALLEDQLRVTPETQQLQQWLEMANLAANIARNLGRLEEAMSYSVQMMGLAEQLDKPIQYGRALHMQGTILAEKGDISTAIKNFHDARRVLENTSDLDNRAMVINALGVAYTLLEDYSRARDYYEDALPLTRAAANRSLELSIISNLALIASKREGPTEGIELHKQALTLARELDHLPQIGNQLANLCSQYVLSGQLQAAESACLEALPIAESLDHKRLLAGTLMTYGDLRFEQNQIEPALDFYQRSLSVVHDALPFIEIELLGKMVDLYEQQSQPSLALEKIRRQHQLREQIVDNERNLAIEELEVQYQVEQRAREVELLQLETELQATELRQSESLLLASTIALVLVLMIILITWRNYQTKSMLQHDLAVRNKELNLAIEQVSHLANRDTLTGLLNRRAFKQAAEEQNAHRLRNKTPLTLVIADIDKFKLINDVHGHPVGDQVLKIIAYRIRQNLRKVDFACRWGGEEFLLLLPETTAEQAHPMIQRLRDILAAEPVETLAGDLPITLTFGLAEVTSNINDAIHAADSAMYTGKRMGPNRVVVNNLISLISNKTG
ncbi:MAG: diguanylate cyclase [Pseudomonadota bacterium]